MIRKYPNHKPPWHHKEEPHNHHETQGRQTKQSNRLSLPHQYDCKTRMDICNVQQNIEQLQTSTMGLTNKKQQKKTPPYNGQQPKSLHCFYFKSNQLKLENAIHTPFKQKLVIQTLRYNWFILH